MSRGQCSLCPPYATKIVGKETLPLYVYSQVGWANGSIVNPTFPHDNVGLRKARSPTYATITGYGWHVRKS